MKHNGALDQATLQANNPVKLRLDDLWRVNRSQINNHASGDIVNNIRQHSTQTKPSSLPQLRKPSKHHRHHRSRFQQPQCPISTPSPLHHIPPTPPGALHRTRYLSRCRLLLCPHRQNRLPSTSFLRTRTRSTTRIPRTPLSHRRRWPRQRRLRRSRLNPACPVRAPSVIRVP